MRLCRGKSKAFPTQPGQGSLPAGPLGHLPGRTPGLGAPAPARCSLQASQGATRPDLHGAPFLLFPGPSPGGRVAPEPWGRRPPPRSQAEQTLTHSCPEGRWRPRGAPEPACHHPPSHGGRLPGGARGCCPAAQGEAGDLGPSPLPFSADPGPGEGEEPARGPGEPRPSSARAAAPAWVPQGRGWRSQPGSYRWRRRWAAAPLSTWGPGGGRAAAARRPGPGRRALRGRRENTSARGPGARGEPGRTWNESEITLFNYTFPRPPSAIGAF